MVNEKICVRFYWTASKSIMALQTKQPICCQHCIPAFFYALVIFKKSFFRQQKISFLKMYCTGPLVSAFVQQFGCRLVIIGGAFVTSLMYFISIFSPNIYVMFLTIGFFGGYLKLNFIFFPTN